MPDHYASTKYRAERIVLAADDPAFATVALRPRAIVGPHDTAPPPRLLRAARRGVIPLPRAGEALIEITDVRDVVTAFLAAEDRIAEASGRVFNIAGGHPLRLKRLTSRSSLASLVSPRRLIRDAGGGASCPRGPARVDLHNASRSARAPR